jgi:hypothetical protein
VAFSAVLQAASEKVGLHKRTGHVIKPGYVDAKAMKETSRYLGSPIREMQEETHPNVTTSIVT